MDFIGIKTITELLKKFAAAAKRCSRCGTPDVSDNIENTKGLCHPCFLKDQAAKAQSKTQLQQVSTTGDDW